MSDPLAARGLTRSVPLDDLLLSEDFQLREGGLSEAAVRLYAENIDRLPAPVVFFDAGRQRYWLPGGFHRLEVFRRAKRAEMPCVVRVGDWQDAFVWALAENSEEQHGLQRKPGDVKKAVLAALRVKAERRLDWSDREIARMCRCGHSWVSDLRLKQEAASVSGPDTDEGGAESEEAEDDAAGPAAPPPVAAPDLNIAEEEGAEAAETAAGAEAPPRSVREALARDLAGVVRGLASLGLLDAHREALGAVRSAVWG